MTSAFEHTRERILQSIARQPLLRLFGVSALEVTEGRIVLACEPRDFMLRTSGIITGGVLAALSDMAGGYALSTLQPEGIILLTVEFKINFLEAAVGDSIKTVAWVLRDGKSIGTCQADIYVESSGVEKRVSVALLSFIKKEHHAPPLEHSPASRSV